MDLPGKKKRSGLPAGGGAAGRQEEFYRQRGMRPKKSKDGTASGSVKGEGPPARKPKGDDTSEQSGAADEGSAAREP